MLPRSLGRRPALILALALSLVGGCWPAAAAAQSDAPAPALAPASDACNPQTVRALIVARNPELDPLWTPPPWLDGDTEGFTPLDVRCIKINGDAIPDALWLLNGGGTGGAFQGGVVESGFGGAPATLTFWLDEAKLTTGTYKGRPAIAWPVYRKQDAGCCPRGGWRWRYYSARPDGTVKQSKLRKSKKNKFPLKRIKATTGG